MSLRRIVKLSTFGNVAADSTATVNLFVGARKYHQLLIKYKDGTANLAAMTTAIPRIRILINGKVQREMTFAELATINAFYGKTFDAGRISIFFSLANLRTSVGEELYGWGTSNVDTFAVEIDIAAGQTAPTLSGIAVIEDSLEPLGPIIKWKRFPGKVAGGAGEFDISDLPKLSGAYWATHLFSQYSTAVQVLVDDLKVFEVNRDDLALIYADASPAISLQANTVSVLFPFTQQGDQILPMVYTRNGVNYGVKDFIVKPTLSQAETFGVIAEIVGLAD